MELNSLYIPTVGPNISNFMITQKNMIVSRSSVLKCTSKLNVGKVVICQNVILRGDLGLITTSDYVIFSDGVILHPALKVQRKK